MYLSKSGSTHSDSSDAANMMGLTTHPSVLTVGGSNPVADCSPNQNPSTSPSSVSSAPTLTNSASASASSYTGLLTTDHHSGGLSHQQQQHHQQHYSAGGGFQSHQHSLIGNNTSSLAYSSHPSAHQLHPTAGSPLHHQIAAVAAAAVTAGSHHLAGLSSLPNHHPHPHVHHQHHHRLGSISSLQQIEKRKQRRIRTTFTSSQLKVS